LGREVLPGSKMILSFRGYVIMKKITFLFSLFLYFFPVIANAQSPIFIGTSGSSITVGEPSVMDSSFNASPCKHNIYINKINDHLFHVHVSILPEKNFNPGD
jgi:hypothetical protein